MNKIIAWATDLHLDHQTGNENFYNEILYAGCDFLFITGDIANGKTIEKYLLEMHDKFNVPIYFVLGNHDYYGSSFKKIRKKMVNLTNNFYDLYWMNESEVIELTPSTAVVGVDGWYDGMYGQANPPKLIMNDWATIKELKQYINHEYLLEKMREIAEEEAYLASKYLKEAAKEYRSIYFLTHVSPWLESSLYENRVSNSTWAPWFTSKALGDVLESVAIEHPNVNFNVLCGHSHHPATYQVAPNLVCRAGKAEYGKPAIAEMIYIKNV